MRMFWYAGLLLLAGIVLFACQSGDLNVGQSVINPQELTVDYIDTVTIKTATVLKADSFVTSNDENILVGHWADAQSGKLTAKSFASFDFPSNTIRGQTNLRLDSLVMELNYSFVYGDTTSLFDVGLHKLNNTIINSSNNTFYNTDSISYEAKPYIQKQVLPQPNSRGKILRIRMPDDLAQSLFTQIYSGEISDNISLTKFLPGFAFVTTSTNNTIAGFAAGTASSSSSSTALSGLKLYYHDIEDVQTSQDVSFQMTYYHFTNINNDRSGTPLSALKKRSDAVDSRLTDNTTFVSLANQLQTRIEFPYLHQFTTPEGYADLNKALLVIQPIRRNSFDNVDPPTTLDLYQANNQNAAIYTIIGGTTPQSGASASYSIDYTSQLLSDSYTFDLTYYIGQLIKKKAVNEPLLLTLNTSSSYTLKEKVQRVTLGNPYRTNDRMQLKLFLSSNK